MKRLFLTSQVQWVAKSITEKLGSDVQKKAVFIDTCIRDKERDNPEWHYKNKQSMENTGITFDVYNIAGKSESEIKKDLDAYELMYVEGGNPFYLLQEAQKNNFCAYVKQRVEVGMIYIGTSAGSILAGPDISSVNRPGKSAADFILKNTKGMGLVNFVIMPHWGDISKKSDYLNYKIPNSYVENYPYILLTDNQYVEVQDDWYRIIDVTEER